jgi:hypothetical protein
MRTIPTLTPFVQQALDRYEVRAALRESAAVLLQQAAMPSAWVDVPAALRAQAEAVARECALRFVRSSARVEGRTTSTLVTALGLHGIAALLVAVALPAVAPTATARARAPRGWAPGSTPRATRPAPSA